MCHRKHFSNPQLGYEELKRYEKTNNEKMHKNKKAAEKTEKAEEEKPREKPREL